MKRRGALSHPRKSSPLVAPTRADEICLELQDYSVVRRSAVEFFKLRSVRDPQAQAARLAEQFAKQNLALAAVLDVRIESAYDGNQVSLLIYSGGRVGAIPLYSPTTARPDYGLVVQPRFPWSGIGPMLGEMGWRVSPTPLRLPLLRRSERRVPVWVLALMILVRLKGLLDSIQRRFEITRESCVAPRGGGLAAVLARFVGEMVLGADREVVVNRHVVGDAERLRELEHPLLEPVNVMQVNPRDAQRAQQRDAGIPVRGGVEPRLELFAFAKPLDRHDGSRLRSHDEDFAIVREEFRQVLERYIANRA